MSNPVLDKFGQRIRLRVCGLCFRGEHVLLINHKGLYAHNFWAPPGGGVEFGEAVETALKREFREECLVNIEVGEFLFGCEFVRQPLHAAELFFKIRLLGEPQLGADPEMAGNSMISSLRFLSPSEVQAMPPGQLHGIFQKVKKPLALMDLKGFFTLT